MAGAYTIQPCDCADCANQTDACNCGGVFDIPVFSASLIAGVAPYNNATDAAAGLAVCRDCSALWDPEGSLYGTAFNSTISTFTASHDSVSHTSAQASAALFPGAASAQAGMWINLHLKAGSILTMTFAGASTGTPAWDVGGSVYDGDDNFIVGDSKHNTTNGILTMAIAADGDYNIFFNVNPSSGGLSNLAGWTSMVATSDKALTVNHITALWDNGSGVNEIVCT